MTHDPVYLLSLNGAAQVLASCLFGSALLVPLQPWGARFAARVNFRALVAAHLDWLMLAFMQWGAAFLMDRYSTTRSFTVALLLIFGGWTNPTPYLWRGFGLNGFVYGGSLAQRLASALAGVSVVCVIAAWATLVVRLAAATP